VADDGGPNTWPRPLRRCTEDGADGRPEAVERIIANVHEPRALAALRDVLLPKLVSGEL
jgi:hypothetical protein